MSSNLEIQRSCLHCGVKFIAKKASTKFCSVPCAQRNYKVRQRMNKIALANSAGKGCFEGNDLSQLFKVEEPDLIDILSLSYATSISKRTIFRLMKDAQFPRIKIGKRLLFDKIMVVKYLQKKFGI